MAIIPIEIWPNFKSRLGKRDAGLSIDVSFLVIRQRIGGDATRQAATHECNCAAAEADLPLSYTSWKTEVAQFGWSAGNTSLEGK
jgi:hypothetical protein